MYTGGHEFGATINYCKNENRNHRIELANNRVNAAGDDQCGSNAGVDVRRHGFDVYFAL